MNFFHIVSCCLLVSSASGWSYHGDDDPSYWSDTYADCGLSKQSPIDIETDSVSLNNSLGAFEFGNYSTTPSSSFTVSNNGHSAQVAVNDDNMVISGGGLSGEYILAQFHFHWGNTSSTGSEHTVDGNQYAAEIHLVHYKNTYSSFNAAVAQEEGLAVLGFFITEEGSDNAAYSDLIDTLSDVTYKDDSVSLGAFPISDLLPDEFSAYYRYDGGLTTPPCYESVVWTVFKNPISLSSSQMAELRTLLEETSTDNTTTSIVDNFRPTQSLGSRVVYDSGAAHHRTPLSFNVLAVLLMALLNITY